MEAQRRTVSRVLMRWWEKGGLNFVGLQEAGEGEEGGSLQGTSEYKKTRQLAEERGHCSTLKPLWTDFSAHLASAMGLD